MGHLGIPHLGVDDTQPHCQLTEQTTPIVCPQPSGGGDGHAGCWAHSGPASSSTSLGSPRRREAQSDVLCSGWTGPHNSGQSPPCLERQLHTSPVRGHSLGPHHEAQPAGALRLVSPQLPTHCGGTDRGASPCPGSWRPGCDWPLRAQG